MKECYEKSGIDASIDDVAKSLVNPITRKPITIRSLPSKEPSNPISGQLNLFIDKQKEIDGIGMGVLSDGTAFLNGRGLALLCGISNARIVEMGQQWDLESPNPMTNGVKKILEDKDILVGRPYTTPSAHTKDLLPALPDSNNVIASFCDIFISFSKKNNPAIAGIKFNLMILW